MSTRDLDFKSSPAFFEEKYTNAGDPWNFSSNPYELNRYNRIIEVISGLRYRRAFEPGCSIGVLTEHLAKCCDEVYAIDFSPSAAAQAQARCAHLPNVEIDCAALGPELPTTDLDLVVFSEVGYYFEIGEWQRLSRSLVNSLQPGATVLAAHWLGHSADHRISGDEVHEILLSHPELQVEHAERNPSFRLDRLVRL